MVRAHGSIRASLFVFVHAPDLFIQPLSRKTIKTSVFILLLFGFSELRLFYFGRLADGGFFWFHCQSRCGFYPSCFWSTWVSVVYCNLIFLRGFVGFRKYFFHLSCKHIFFYAVTWLPAFYWVPGNNHNRHGRGAAGVLEARGWSHRPTPSGFFPRQKQPTLGTGVQRTGAEGGQPRVRNDYFSAPFFTMFQGPSYHSG